MSKKRKIGKAVLNTAAALIALRFVLRFLDAVFYSVGHIG